MRNTFNNVICWTRKLMHGRFNGLGLHIHAPLDEKVGCLAQ